MQILSMPVLSRVLSASIHGVLIVLKRKQLPYRVASAHNQSFMRSVIEDHKIFLFAR